MSAKKKKNIKNNEKKEIIDNKKQDVVNDNKKIEPKKQNNINNKKEQNNINDKKVENKSNSNINNKKEDSKKTKNVDNKKEEHNKSKNIENNKKQENYKNKPKNSNGSKNQAASNDSKNKVTDNSVKNNLNNSSKKNVNSEKKQVNNNIDKKNKEKSKEEELVFKDVKKTSKSKVNTKDIKFDSQENKSNNKKENATDNKNDKKEKNKVVNNINTEEFFEKKKNKKRKALFIIFVIFIILTLAMCFSTIYAILGNFKSTIARGVKINGVDVSNLTYDEAKQKITEVIDVQLTPDIELVHNDYKYTIKMSDIGYEYNLINALEKAYNVGRTGNIAENNYSLIKTAILGEDIYMETTYDMEAIDAIIDIIDTNIPGRVKQYSYYIEGANLIITPGTDGVTVKTDELKEQILSSIKNRDYNTILDNYGDIKIEIPYENVKADKIDATKISGEITTEPQNAYYVEATETTDFAIYPAKDGISFAISIEEAQDLVDSEQKTEYIIPLNITKAEVQLNDIGVEAFPYEIQKFSTRYDASNYSRSKNLEIAASKINGTVLMPGEIFSFNNVVGERTVAEGYKNAKIYSNGQVVDGLAGGICQISSTLYNAVLLSNLEIVERYNHSFTTSYVAAGRDATVVYGIKDFKFKNNRNYPIKIEASVANGIATFSIHGIKEDEEYTVKIIPKTTQTIPYTTQTIVDTTLEAGTMKVTQAGASGCKVTTYKELYLNGTLISSEIISNDVYQVMTRIVRANPTVEETASSIVQ